MAKVPNNIIKGSIQVSTISHNIAYADLQERYYEEPARDYDVRDAYQRDKGRIIHCAGFRRLQSKTQVMPIGENDYHRTRLTHSLEVAQIGEGILLQLHHHYEDNIAIKDILPSPALITSACYAHDLGHPPFGHAGENALFQLLQQHDPTITFEGNGQTLRNIVRCENYRRHHDINQGINPSRRLLLAILKYPASFGQYKTKNHGALHPKQIHPPKCYYDSEKNFVDWACAIFSDSDYQHFQTIKKIPNDDNHLLTNNFSGKTIYKTLDCGLMELADDIAYSIHDVEDMIAVGLIHQKAFTDYLENFIHQTNSETINSLNLYHITQQLFSDESARKQAVAKLVHEMISHVTINHHDDFEHPLLHFQATLPDIHREFTKFMKSVTFQHVINHANHQQLDRKYERIITGLFYEFINNTERLLPQEFIKQYDNTANNNEIVRDYIAQMTSPQAEKAYKRLFAV